MGSSYLLPHQRINIVLSKLIKKSFLHPKKSDFPRYISLLFFSASREYISRPKVETYIMPKPQRKNRDLVELPGVGWIDERYLRLKRKIITLAALAGCALSLYGLAALNIVGILCGVALLVVAVLAVS
jgi:hypothetical protein